MGNLILVPQYPAHLRYQSWWLPRLRDGYAPYFDDVIVLDPSYGRGVTAAPQGAFAPSEQAIAYELEQIHSYNAMPLDRDDVLLLCDISYPGLFANALFHKRPRRCFAVCHGSALNRLDVFAGDRWAKRSVETGVSRLFDCVFVATQYHKDKLDWPGKTHVVRFPLPDVRALAGAIPAGDRSLRFISVARNNPQKVRPLLEEKVVEQTASPIHRYYLTGGDNWPSYFRFVASGQFLIVTAREETFGYQVIDALAVGTMPVAPRALSYPEILPDHHLYTPGDWVSLVNTVYKLERQPSHPALWKDTFIHDTATIMQGISP